MAALLNSLQMGFRTLAIQKRSQEVWAVLSRVKKEFATFEGVLDKTRQRLRQADDELDRLVGTRTNQINRALSKVETLEAPAGADDFISADDTSGGLLPSGKFTGEGSAFEEE
jgi:DNA recombination protein RmuC